MMQVKGHAAPVCGAIHNTGARLGEVLSGLSSGQKGGHPESQGSSEEGQSRHPARWPHVTFARVRLKIEDVIEDRR